MEPRVLGVYRPDKPKWIKGKENVAVCDLMVSHFVIKGIKIMRCPERGLICWAPAGVRLSMEGREMLQNAVKERLDKVHGDRS